MMKRFRAPIFVLFVVGCATLTPLGQTYQAAGILATANEQVQEECDRSKAQGRIRAETIADPAEAERVRLQGDPPFTKKTCAALGKAYKLASKAARDALAITADPSKQAPAQLTAYGVRYVYTVVVYLGEAGVKPAKDLQSFVDIVNRELLKTREVK